ncbi:MAG: SurA N-terminal domain-containing protein [Clostridia bacterium]|nr:SurA N-terminal domain-containing protein [Clostridia bacterium]
MKKIFPALILVAALVTGCSTADKGTNEDYAVKINATEVSKEEFNVYLYETQRSFEQLGGEDIWETDFDGKSAESVAKDSTLATLTLVKLSAERAEKNGISLSAEEAERAAEEADAIYDGLTDEERVAIGADRELYHTVLTENALCNEVYDDTVKNYVVSDEGFDEYFENNRETLEERYKSYMGSEDPVDETALMDYSRGYYEEYMKQSYFSKEYEKWESSASVEKNAEVWDSITLIK